MPEIILARKRREIACLFFTPAKVIFKLRNCIFDLMDTKRVYNIKVAIERLKNYCSLQDKCQWDVIQKMREWGLLKMSQDLILVILIVHL